MFACMHIFSPEHPTCMWTLIHPFPAFLSSLFATFKNVMTHEWWFSGPSTAPTEFSASPPGCCKLSASRSVSFSVMSELNEQKKQSKQVTVLSNFYVLSNKSCNLIAQRFILWEQLICSFSFYLGQISVLYTATVSKINIQCFSEPSIYKGLVPPSLN